jgi:AcrR family transcriptional regulator
MNKKIFIHFLEESMQDKKELIYNCARKIFGSKGFKDTAISDIAQSAGISVGTFYNYYSSKENLFMEIFLHENVKLKKECFEKLDKSMSPMDTVKQMMELNFQGMKANTILSEWYNKAVFEKIEKTYRQENGVNAVDFLYGDFLKIVEQWQAQGKMRADIDSRMIMMIFASIINIDTHKQEIGLEYFPQLVHIITELIMQSLTPPQK